MLILLKQNSLWVTVWFKEYEEREERCVNQDRNEIRTYSDPALAARCILVLFLISIASVMLSFLAVGAWKSRLYGFTIILIIQIVALIIISTIHMAANLTNSLTMVSFTENGIVCTLLGDKMKAFSWESIQHISEVKNMYGMTLGPHIKEQFREYCVFSTRELGINDVTKIIMSASGKNGVAVIPLNEKLLKRIRSQYEAFYRHAKVEVPLLID